MRCFIMKWLKILIVKVVEFGNPSTKNINRQRYFIVCFEVFQVEWDVPIACQIFPKKLFLNLCALHGEIFHASHIG